MAKDPDEPSDSEVRLEVSGHIMAAAIIVHWAAHLIEERDPAVGKWLRHKGDRLSAMSKDLRRR